MLVVGQLIGLRNGDGWFAPAEVESMFEDLRVPRPGGLGTVLSRLEGAKLMLRRSARRGWSLTPEGRERVLSLVGAVDPASVEAEAHAIPGAELGQTRHPTIPPALAPARFRPAIARLLDRFPFETNVFCMTRFPKDVAEGKYPDPVKAVLRAAREVLGSHGLRLHLASDRNADDELFGNVAAHMWACQYGIGLFETRFGEELNDNVLIEVGGMLLTGRRCALLKDVDTPDLPTDFVGHIYKSVDFTDLDDVINTIDDWVVNDVSL